MTEVKVIRVVHGIQVHHADDRRCIASKGLTIVESFDHGETWQVRCRLPSSSLRGLLLRSSIYSRLVRGGIHSALPMRNGENTDWIVVAEGKLYQVSADGGRIDEIFEIRRGRRPIRRGWCIVGDEVLIGEYWKNPNREAVNIYSLRPADRQVKTLHQFAQKSVRHIHIVEQDPYSDSLWIATGDADSECIIARFNRDTGQLQPIGHGSQQWRTVSLAFRPEAVYWGTDNQLGENQIWRYDRATGTMLALSDTIGPVYYNVCLDDYIIFGTTVEKGEGQQDGFGRFYAVDTNDTVAAVWQSRKSRLDLSLFWCYGIFEYAAGRLSGNRFWVTAKGFEGGYRSILFELTGG